ncbi:MAG: ParB/RepB/Spo0J family partition protein [Helicobacteraceae bacterium]
MAKKTGLGRGLGAIFQEVESAYEKGLGVRKSDLNTIKIDEIELNPFQPRKQFDEEALQELSASIKKHGVIQPILVVEKEKGFMLIAGERRLRASRLAGLETIKAVIVELPQSSFREIALIENIQRENLNPLELAQSYKELINDYAITHEELAQIVHKSRTHITNTMRLLNLGSYAAQKLLSLEITHGHAKILVGLSEKDERKIVDSIINQNLNVRQTEKLVKSIKEETSAVKKEQKIKFDFKPVISRFAACGIRAKVSGSKIVISVENAGELEKLLEIIN